MADLARALETYELMVQFELIAENPRVARGLRTKAGMAARFLRKQVEKVSENG